MLRNGRNESEVGHSVLVQVWSCAECVFRGIPQHSRAQLGWWRLLWSLEQSWTINIHCQETDTHYNRFQISGPCKSEPFGFVYKSFIFGSGVYFLSESPGRHHLLYFDLPLQLCDPSFF